MKNVRWMAGAGWFAVGMIALAPSAEPSASREATPLFALWELEAGAAAAEGLPAVVLYDDGTIIARRAAAAGAGKVQGTPASSYVTRRLPLADLNPWYDDIFTILKEDDLQSSYRMDDSRDSPMAVFHFQAGARSVLVQVRGLSAATLTPFGTPLHPTAEDVPPRLYRIFQDAARLRLEDAQIWTPAHVEARFGATPTPPARAAAWPAEWPVPAAGADVVRLPRTELARAPGLVTRWGVRRPVAMVDGMMSVTFRPVFPGEAVWRTQLATMAGDHEDVARVPLPRESPPISAPASAIGASPPERVSASTAVLTPALDRATAKITFIPPTPDPPNPKSKRSR